MIMNGNDSDAFRQEAALRVMRIVVSALMIGILSFLGIVIFLVQQREPNPNQQIIISYIAIGFFAIILVSWWVVPDLMMNNSIERIAAGTWTAGTDRDDQGVSSRNFPTDASKLLVVYQVKTIVASGLLEGAAFFGCIAYLQEGQVYTLGVPGVVLALMALTFPTRDRVNQWVEMQERRIQEKRAFR